MKIYVVQIDMSDRYDGSQWENADLAFPTRDQAELDIQFKIEEYGIDPIGLRVVELELVDKLAA